MIVSNGEKLHIIIRRKFEEDIRRHFTGIIADSEGAVIRAEGYTFIFNRAKNRFIKKPEKRFGIFDLSSDGYLVNILPSTVLLENLVYQTTEEGYLMFTDNKEFSLDINELSVKR